MINTFFVPVTCAACNRTSALELSVSELKQKLDADADIELRCGYDDVTWNATAKRNDYESQNFGTRTRSCRNAIGFR